MPRILSSEQHLTLQGVIFLRNLSLCIAIFGCILAGISFLTRAKPHTKIIGLVGNGLLALWMLLLKGLLF
jgi:hypothetical protein